jgi:hypothetical protein
VKFADAIQEIHGQDSKDNPSIAPEVAVICSPPWGILSGKTGQGEEDELLTQVQMVAMGSHVAKYMPTNSMIILHLPLKLYAAWADALAQSGFLPLLHPFIVQTMARKPAKWGLADQLVENVHMWFGFRKSTDSPAHLHPVKFLLDMYADNEDKKPSQLNTVYRASTTVATFYIPKEERIRVKVDGAMCMLRVQQLSGAAVAKVILNFVRTSVFNKTVIIVDPFGGAGGTVHGARLTDTYCILGDRDKVCLEKVQALLKGAKFENRGSALMELPKFGEMEGPDEEGYEEEEESPHKGSKGTKKTTPGKGKLKEKATYNWNYEQGPAYPNAEKGIFKPNETRIPYESRVALEAEATAKAQETKSPPKGKKEEKEAVDAAMDELAAEGKAKKGKAKRKQGTTEESNSEEDDVVRVSQKPKGGGNGGPSKKVHTHAHKRYMCTHTHTCTHRPCGWSSWQATRSERARRRSVVKRRGADVTAGIHGG